MEIAVSVHSLDEQRYIGRYFCHLDRLITLHQRKCAQLCNFKKSMLEKMFPKEGSDVPEIRLAGFVENWKQRKMTEFVDFSRSNLYPSMMFKRTERLFFVPPM